jgi:hypothetical protein
MVGFEKFFKESSELDKIAARLTEVFLALEKNVKFSVKKDDRGEQGFYLRCENSEKNKLAFDHVFSCVCCDTLKINNHDIFHNSVGVFCNSEGKPEFRMVDDPEKYIIDELKNFKSLITSVATVREAGKPPISAAKE